MTGLPPEGAAGLAVAIALGLIFGSFANVCIHRLPSSRSVVRPGSACPDCGAAILWHDNVPVLSWVLLRGRCRACRAPISAGYPAVEAASAILLATLYLQHGLTPRWAALSWLAVSVLVLAPIDLRHGILPDRVTLPGLAVGLLSSPAAGGPGLAGALWGAAAGALVPLAIRSLYMGYARLRLGPRPVSAEPEADADQREGMGLGDVKMLAMVGAFLGVPGALLTLMVGSVAGTLVVLPLVAARRRRGATAVPFGPFLGVGTFVSLLWGPRIVGWYLELPGLLTSG